MLRLVLDTDAIGSAFFSPDGASRQLVMGALDEKFTLLLSTPLLLEYETAMRRQIHLTRANAANADVMEIPMPWPGSACQWYSITIGDRAHA